MKTFILFFIFSILPILAENPLTPLKLNSPRKTLKVFLESMNTYKEGLDSNDEEKLKKIQLAVKCLDLSDLSPLIRKDKGKEIAIFLKETIDRIYVPRKDYSDIPESQGEIPIVVRWVIPDTEITILLQDNSEYNSEFRFSSETVLQAFE